MPFAQSLSVKEVKAALPENYSFVKYLRKGGFGQVVKCQSKDTHQNVAIKLPYHEQNTENEILLLTRFAEAGYDQRNIVKFLGAFDTRLGKAMIFELLDMSLFEYNKDYGPLPLSIVSTIIKQVSIALEALKHWSIIHTDIKRDNVMIVDHRQRPLQTPEIILGLPWNEAVDVWNLGTMFAHLCFDIQLFPSTNPYNVLKVMFHFFGAPPDDVLSLGVLTKKYFRRTNNTWIFKTFKCNPGFYYTEKFRFLHLLAKVKAATDLLTQMLTMEASARITPSQILQHPFICPQSDVAEAEPQEQLGLVQQTSVRKPVLITAKPAAPENTSPLKEEDDKHLKDRQLPVPEQMDRPLPVHKKAVRPLTRTRSPPPRHRLLCAEDAAEASVEEAAILLFFVKF